MQNFNNIIKLNFILQKKIEYMYILQNLQNFLEGSLFNYDNLFNKYWLNPNVFYDEILGGIDINTLNKFFYYFEKILSEQRFWLWLNSCFNKFNNIIFPYCILDKTLKLKIKYFKKKKVKKNVYLTLCNEKIVYELVLLYNKLYKKCLNFLYNLDLLLLNNKQELIISLNCVLEKLYVYEYKEYKEYLWFDYRLNNDKIKYNFNIKKQNKKLNKIVFDLENLYLLINSKCVYYNKQGLLGHYKGVGLHYISFTTNEDIFDKLNLAKYKSININFRLNNMKKILKNKKHIKLAKKIKNSKLVDFENF